MNNAREKEQKAALVHRTSIMAALLLKLSLLFDYLLKSVKMTMLQRILGKVNALKQ